MNWHKLFLAGAALGLAACTTYDGPPANPIERSLTWFSFIAGDDIRANCQPGEPDHYRFVYNAVYPVQIRAYELTPIPDGARLTVRARGRAGRVDRFSFERPFGPWELLQGQTQITNPTAAAIVDAYADAVEAAPSMAGKNIASNEFYWIVAACSSGDFSLKAFVDPRVDLNALEFPKLLLRHDPSGVPFREAEFVEGQGEGAFTIQINREGTDLIGLL